MKILKNNLWALPRGKNRSPGLVTWPASLFIFLSVLLFTGCGDNDSSGSTTEKETVYEWQVVGTEGFSDGKVSTGKYGANTVVAINQNNEPYVLYSDRNYENTVQNPRVKKFNSAEEVWQDMPRDGIETSASFATSMSLLFDNNNPYMIYQSGYGGLSGLVYRYFNGSVWEGPSLSFTYNHPTITPFTAAAIEKSGKPYVAFIDEYTNELTVMKFDGNKWAYFGDILPANVGFLSKLDMAVITDNNPVVAVQDAGTGKIVVYRHENGNWVTWGGAAASSGAADAPQLVIGSDFTPYLAYIDENSGKVVVRMIVNNSWATLAGKEQFTPTGIEDVKLALDTSNIPYIAFADPDNGKKMTVMKLKDGNWETVGRAGFSSGGADSISMALDGNNTPYVAFEDLASSRKLTVMKYAEKKPEVKKYKVSGTVSGHTGTVVLLNTNGDETLSIPAGTTSFEFGNEYEDGSLYNVKVSEAPSGQTCEVANGEGFIKEGPVEDIAVTCTNVPAPAGAADPTFNNGEPFRYNFSGNSTDQAHAVTIDNSNRILVAGKINNRFGVLRLKENGTVDTNFGVNGIWFPSGLNSGTAYFIKFNGNFGGYRIHVIGGTGGSGSGQYIAAYTVSQDGTTEAALDHTLTARNGYPIAATHAADGAFYTASNGVSDNGTVTDGKIGLVKIVDQISEMSLYSTFGNSGIIEHSVSQLVRPARITAEGSKLIVSGNYGYVDVFDTNGNRLTTNTINYSSTGTYGLTVPNGDGANMLTIMDENADTGNFNFYLTKYSDYSINTYNAQGSDWRDLNTYGFANVNTISKDSQGRFIIGGVSRNLSDNKYYGFVARFNSDYSPDTSFNTVDNTAYHHYENINGSDHQLNYINLVYDLSGRLVVIGFGDDGTGQGDDIFIYRITP